jgi:hypothetical protein
MPVGDTATAVTGTLDFLDNAVDSMTGTIALKAEFANKGQPALARGLVRVQLALSVDKGAFVVPSSAVVTGQQGSYVYVVDSGVARIRPVTLRRQSDSIAVLSAGVGSGDQVVIEGQLRLTDGAKVQCRNRVTDRDRRKVPHELERTIHQAPGHDDARHVRDLVFGVVAYRSLPVSDLPPVDYPTIS